MFGSLFPYRSYPNRWNPRGVFKEPLGFSLEPSLQGFRILGSAWRKKIPTSTQLMFRWIYPNLRFFWLFLKYNLCNFVFIYIYTIYLHVLFSASIHSSSLPPHSRSSYTRLCLGEVWSDGPFRRNASKCDLVREFNMFFIEIQQGPWSDFVGFHLVIPLPPQVSYVSVLWSLVNKLEFTQMILFWMRGWNPVYSTRLARNRYCIELYRPPFRCITKKDLLALICCKEIIGESWMVKLKLPIKPSTMFFTCLVLFLQF